MENNPQYTKDENKIINIIKTHVRQIQRKTRQIFSTSHCSGVVNDSIWHCRLCLKPKCSQPRTPRRDKEEHTHIKRSKEKEEIKEKRIKKKKPRMALSSVFPPVRLVRTVMSFPVEMEAAGHQTTRFCWSRKRFR